jgi:hypothetical protein
VKAIDNVAMSISAFSFLFMLLALCDLSWAEESVPVEEDLSLAGWVTDQPTFNYKLPCDIDITTGVAIVVHGLNRADVLEENDEGELVHARDISIAYPRMEELCLAITLPKSGLSATYEMVENVGWSVTHPAKLKSSSTGTDSSAHDSSIFFSTAFIASSIKSSPSPFIKSSAGHALLSPSLKVGYRQLMKWLTVSVKSITSVTGG